MIPERALFETFRRRWGEWHCATREEIPPKQMRFLGATDYLLCDYQRSGPARSGPR